MKCHWGSFSSTIVRGYHRLCGCKFTLKKVFTQEKKFDTLKFYLSIFQQYINVKISKIRTPSLISLTQALVVA